MPPSTCGAWKISRKIDNQLREEGGLSSPLLDVSAAEPHQLASPDGAADPPDDSPLFLREICDRTWRKKTTRSPSASKKNSRLSTRRRENCARTFRKFSKAEKSYSKST